MTETTNTTARPLPPLCPSWCTTEHHSYVEDGDDPLEHWGPTRGMDLPTIHNQVDGRVERDGGGGCEMYLGQRSIGDGGLGYEGGPTVELQTRDINRNRAIVKLTSGEARTLARQLESLADVIDLGPA